MSNTKPDQPAPVAPILPFELEVLRQHSLLFAALDKADLPALLALGQLQMVAHRQVVCRAGEPGESLYVVLGGSLKVSLSSPEGKEVILSLLGTGDLFGEMSLFDGHPRSATVSSLEDCRLLVILRRDFLPFLETHPKVCLKLLAALSQRLRTTNDLVENLSFQALPSRLAKLLIHLGQQYGRAQPDGVSIGLRLSQEELGNLAGASRESVNKQIRAWADAGLLEYSRGKIKLKKVDLLYLQTVAP